ncbi:MAG: hypothetical protein IKL79_03885 [Clostridia bacterium]|nr:hypothetical protein [Clostridia bacterium]
MSVVVCTLYDSKIYTLAEAPLDKNSLHIYVVEFDVASNSSTLVFDSDIICSWVYAYRGSNGILGIYSTAGNKEYYYSYVIETGEFIKDKVDDKQFDIDIYNDSLFNAQKGGFTIVNRETGVKKMVNADTVSASEYANCFSDLFYYPGTYAQCGDTIVLAYIIDSCANKGFDFTVGYFYACFTYDFETEALEFDSLLYTNEGEGVNLSYNTQ